MADTNVSASFLLVGEFCFSALAGEENHLPIHSDLLEQFHHLGFGGALIVQNAGKDDDSAPQFDELEGALLYVTGATL